MATISIDYNSAKKEIYLCGDVAAIKRNRFAWRYVRDYLSPREEDNRLIIPVMEEEPFAVLSSIRSMLSKYGFSEKNSNHLFLLDSSIYRILALCTVIKDHSHNYRKAETCYSNSGKHFLNARDLFGRAIK